MRHTSCSRLRLILAALLPCCLLLSLTACEVERRRSDAELGLNPQQVSGRHIYDQYCDRCHVAYSSKDRKGPSLHGVFTRDYLSVSGMPAYNAQIGDIIRMGRITMEGIGQVLSQVQYYDL